MSFQDQVVLVQFLPLGEIASPSCPVDYHFKFGRGLLDTGPAPGS